MTREFKVTDERLAEAYEIAIQASRWAFSRFPQLKYRLLEHGDLAAMWWAEKARYLMEPDDKECMFTSFRYQVFLGVYRMAINLANDSLSRSGLSKLSLDAYVGGPDGDRFVDLTAGAESSSPEHGAEMEDLLSRLEGMTIGSEPLVETPMGVRPPSLRTVAEMLLAGYTKLEVAESFGVTKQYISKVTRGKMAQTLGLA